MITDPEQLSSGSKGLEQTLAKRSPITSKTQASFPPKRIVSESKPSPEMSKPIKSKEPGSEKTNYNETNNQIAHDEELKESDSTIEEFQITPESTAH